MAIRTIVAASLVAMAAAGVAQDVPVAPPEIVVEGERPHVDAGMWRVRRWPTRSVTYSPNSPGSGRAISLEPGWETRICIADGRATDAIARLLGHEDRTLGCSRLTVRMLRGRLSGRKTCTRLGGGAGIVDTETRYRGTITPTRIDVRIATRMTLKGEAFHESDVRLEADRAGDCALPAARVIPALDPAPPPGAPPAAADARVPSPEALPVAESPDDIVVVARRLRTLRLRYTSTGRRLYFCHADVSSGDRRVDRIGCAIVRACVRAGFGESGPDIACFRRKVDSLEPD